VTETAFVDASPLILLSLTGHVELLRCAATRIVVPRAVEAEVSAHAEDRRTAETMEAMSWIEILGDAPPHPAVAAWDLGAGESAVLTMSLRAESAIAVIDDLAARRCAAAMGVPLVGTLGLLVRARRLGRIAAVRPVLAEIRAAGMYLSDDLVARTLRSIGE